ncbi:SDR family NAD(P)-dependent oxidoreductase [Haloarchaeobius sp. HME9146]|uniref:SDR family NAD(P)-dependent oxidoreductase n=1 Tax=Haloarchaeobius sp. HME9146 TaxID=2978732 RepID=UPI0021BFB266|nr:SDR family NAD(P)-dependent oxidoreductase [Haloarchaeobius sp. HME9146]MCT9095045.1 SDR family NAD(P)-dependent oxidoreductase [Haloarchaeobius sp. HME9146]
MPRTAVIAGVGPGLGASLARKFANEGCSVGLFARSEEYIEDLAADLREETPGEALAVPTDLTDPDQIREGFAAVRDEFGPVDVLVNHASAAPWKGLSEVSHDEFQQALDVGVTAALHCSKEAVADMRQGDGGTVIFTGATTSIRGRKGSVAFSAAKFGARGLAESMARELVPEGVHVAHVVIDGGILHPEREVEHPGEYLDPDAIAESYWHLVEQDRSAWTLELDLRPHVEEF